MAIMGLTRDTVSYANNQDGNSLSSSASLSKQAKNLDSKELEKLGVRDVGELLNKVSDSNWVDPKSKLRGVGSDKLDKDAFMKIMLTQMKHQDPTNPLKSHEMAAQLAQFTQLEQLQNINTTLSEMKSEAKPAETFQTLNLLGKMVQGDSAKIYRGKGDRDHDITYSLPADAKLVTLNIKNELGEKVRTVTMNNAKLGNQKWSWNGRNDKDVTMPIGNYKVEVTALNSADQKLQVKTDFEGVISGVNFTPEGAVLLIGNQNVRLQDVRKIVDPSLKNKDQNVQAQAKPDLNVTPNAGSNDEKGAQEAPEEATSRVLDQAALSREMMEKVARQISGPPQKAGE